MGGTIQKHWTAVTNYILHLVHFVTILQYHWGGQRSPVVSTLDLCTNGPRFKTALGLSLCSKEHFIHITYLLSTMAWHDMTYDVERAIKPQLSIHTVSLDCFILWGFS